MDKKVLWIAIGVVAVGAVGYLAWDLGQEEPLPVPQPMVQTPRPTAPAAPSGPAYPIEPPKTEAAAPLPGLEDSDAAVGNALAQLLGAESLPAYFYPDKMIRRFVVTIDNLPRRKVTASMLPVAPVAGAFKVKGSDSRLTIDPANAARYGLYLNVLQTVDVARLMDVYVRFYPLFQEAYLELGYPKGYFNDRLVEAIDDLLDAPDVQAPIRLVRPNVLYQYADPDLEALSAGQRIMIRMGADNAERVKMVLRTIREEVVRRAAQTATEPQEAKPAQ